MMIKWLYDDVITWDLSCIPPPTIICAKIMIFLVFYESVTDRRTDRRTDVPGYRDARTHLKRRWYQRKYHHKPPRDRNRKSIPIEDEEKGTLVLSLFLNALYQPVYHHLSPSLSPKWKHREKGFPPSICQICWEWDYLSESPTHVSPICVKQNPWLHL